MRQGLTDTTNKPAAAVHSSDENTEDLIALGDEDKYLKLTSPTASPDKKKSRKSGMYITHNYFMTRDIYAACWFVVLFWDDSN